MNNIELLRKYKELLDEGIITQEEFETKRNQILSQPDVVQNQESAATNTAQELAKVTGADEEASVGWGILGFFIPLVGLILFLVWKDTKPKAARYSGIGALAGVTISIVGWVISVAVASSSMY